MDEYLEVIIGTVKASRLDEEDTMFPRGIPTYCS